VHHIDEGPYVSRIPMQPSCPLVQQPCGLAAAQAPACDRQLFAAATRTEISLPRLIGVRWRRERISHWAAEEGTQMTRDRFSFQSSETLRKRKVWGSFPHGSDKSRASIQIQLTTHRTKGFDRYKSPGRTPRGAAETPQLQIESWHSLN
jgi:hypothetical protein